MKYFYRCNTIKPILTAGDDKENRETRYKEDGNINQSGEGGFTAIQCVLLHTFRTD
jgi:hypothetical protein